MNPDTLEMYGEDIEAEENEAEIQRQAEIQKGLKKTLDLCKPYKELVTSNPKSWEDVKEAITKEVYRLIEVGNEYISRDFLAGVKHCQELIDARVEQFDKAFEALGKEA